MFDQFINWNVLKLGWPLVLLPVLIHLFNRLRHKKMPWAAMMFLRVASRKSTKYAKLRQFLILFMRMLAVLALIMAISRPLAGSWLGGMMSSKPETVLFVMDRSVTMESKDTGRASKREAAVKLLEDTAKSFPGIELWYLDPVVGTPQRVDRLQMEQSGGLGAQFEINATDVPTDVPRLLETAADWLKKNKSGNCEIWLASDMQQSNWHPDAAGRWAAVASGLGGKDVPFKARVQVLAKTQSVSNNFSVRVQEARQREVRTENRLELVLKFTGPADASRPMPLKFHLNGKDVPENEVDANHRQFNLSAATTRRQGQEAELVQNVFLPLANAPATGWGYVQIGSDLAGSERYATDDNPRDNRSYFVYGPGLEKARALIVGPQHFSAGYLRLAADPFDNNIAKVVTPEALAEVKFTDYASVLWHGALPTGDLAVRLQQYLAQGGVTMFVPEANATVSGDRAFVGVSWGSAQAATNLAGQPLANWRQALPGVDNNKTGKPEKQGGFLVGGWKDREGPLSNAQNEKPLPVTDLVTIRRAGLVDHAKLAVEQIQLAQQVADALSKGNTSAGVGNMLRELQQALNAAATHAEKLGTVRWTADRAVALKTELIESLANVDPLDETAATQAMLRLVPLIKQWATELESATGGYHLLAHYEDGASLLARQLVGRGQAYFLATRPDEAWSSLQEEWVFLILVQRLLQTGEALGAGSYSVAHSRVVGVFKPEGESAVVTWNAKVGEGDAPDYRRDAGIYESADGQVLALNRPPTEDDARYFGPDQEHLLKSLFAGVPLHVHWENSSDTAGKAAAGPKEVWRWLLVFMAAFLLGEAILILPRTSDETVAGRAPVQPATST
ncbi:MAG: hypothetical protein EXS22_01645 [Pedosphaera sp.]|nr:hypothetical protein [Pedosphaera sp.]